MSEELLSALLDGECSPGEVKRLMEELDRSPALKQRWSRMCAVRDAMDSTRVPAVSADFCSGVMAAIEREKAAPQPSKVVALPVRKRPVAAAGTTRASRWQPFAGLAAAASIAAVVTVGGYRLLNQPVGSTQTASLSPAAADTQPVSFSTASNDSGQAHLVPVSATSGGEPAETRWSQLDADTAQQLSEYMMEHSNMRAGQGVGAALSYPRMTLRTAEYRSGERH